VPYLNAVENVMLAQYLHSLADEAEAARALEEVGLGHRLRHLPADLSGGERQRVCIARALINRPPLVLADEPTGSLDAANERAVLDLFQTIHERGQTIVMVTHDLAVGRRASRQVQLEHGHVAGEFLTQAQDEEAIDEVLEYLWLRGEGGTAAHEICALGERLATPQLLERMRTRGIITPGPRPGDDSAFTEPGRRRAESLVRRHRLAETLFSNTFQMHEAIVEEEACFFEHILSPVMTDSICAFLGHPEACPHGKLIPRGACCAARPAATGSSAPR
jgi:energy-coupling factor transporter ATP-binding protein EcfA2